MSQFQQDIVKILLDKLLLGVIAAAFGFYLSRLLEDYRTKNAYRLLVVQQRIEACRTLVSLVGEHHQHVLKLHFLVKQIIEQRPKKVSDEETKPAFAYIESHEMFRRRVTSLVPFLPGEAMDALNNYLDIAMKVAMVVKGAGQLPTEEALDTAFVGFMSSCNVIVSGDPFDKATIGHGKAAA